MREDGTYGNSEAALSGSAGAGGTDGARAPGRAWLAVGNHLVAGKPSPGSPPRRTWWPACVRCRQTRWCKPASTAPPPGGSASNPASCLKTRSTSCSGSNSDERTIFNLVTPTLDPSGYANTIHTQFDALAAGADDTILSLYPAADYTNPNYAVNAVDSDAYFTCNTRNLARAVSGAQRPRVWRYLFTHAYENDAILNTWRAFHSAELAFVSGNLQTLLIGGSYSPSSAETALAEQMMNCWARFAATGDPKGSGAAPWLA